MSQGNTQTNFYYKLEVSATEAVELYVGKSCGKQVLFDLQNARDEVLIISPYIDATKLDELIKLRNRNVNVRLAFSSLREAQERDILKKLIHQNRFTNERAREAARKKSAFFNYAAMCSLLSGIIALAYSVFKTLQAGHVHYSLSIPVLAYLLFRYLSGEKSRAEQTPIYSYDYSEKINFKYLRSGISDNQFIHSKIYVIDRRLAYIGSLNFTNNGFTSNFEARVRITHREKIAELVSFIHTIFDDDRNFIKHELTWLGRRVYSEEKW